MHTTLFSIADAHIHGDLFPRLLRARKEVFIDKHGWALDTVDGMEYDAYDTPAARHLAIQDDEGRILAGMRLLPTTARNGVYSYMIRDAQKGMLATIPADLLHGPAPVDPLVWEGTRGFIHPDVPHKQRLELECVMYGALRDAAAAYGYSSLLILVTARWRIWAKKVKMEMEEMGPVVSIDGGPHVALSMIF